MTTDSLTIYAIKRSVEQEQIEHFNQVIIPERRKRVSQTRIFRAPVNLRRRWSANLYVWKGEIQQPRWTELLKEGFGKGIDVTGSAQDCAVVVVKIEYYGDRLFAIPFGSSGRFQIRPEVIDRGYGLRATLNALYEGDKTAAELDAVPRIRRVESKTVAANTMRTVRQANRRTDFGDFDLNPDTDQLSSIEGQPSDSALARRVRGADSLRVARRTSFEELGELCLEVARTHRRSDYQRRFAFVDRFQGITDPTTIGRLDVQLRDDLLADPHRWEFSIPDIHDFDRLAAVRVTTSNGNIERFPDPTMHEIVELVKSGFSADAESILAARVETLDESDEPTGRWLLRECIDGQLLDEGPHSSLTRGPSTGLNRTTSTSLIRLLTRFRTRQSRCRLPGACALAAR